MADYFIADTHFGHGNIIKYCARPFLNSVERKQFDNHEDFKVSRESIDLMDEYMLDQINSTVDKDDVLHHEGDFSFAPYQIVRNYREKIRCRNIFLTWGNHDRREVEGIFTGCHEQELVTIDRQRIFKNHYPMLTWDGSHKGVWMLHGHTHGGLRKNLAVRALYDKMLILDVGVDGPDGVGSRSFGKPWSMAEIREYMAPKIALQKANKF